MLWRASFGWKSFTNPRGAYAYPYPRSWRPVFFIAQLLFFWMTLLEFPIFSAANCCAIERSYSLKILQEYNLPLPVFPSFEAHLICRSFFFEKPAFSIGGWFSTHPPEVFPLFAFPSLFSPRSPLFPPDHLFSAVVTSFPPRSHLFRARSHVFHRDHVFGLKIDQKTNKHTKINSRSMRCTCSRCSRARTSAIS